MLKKFSYIEQDPFVHGDYQDLAELIMDGSTTDSTSAIENEAEERNIKIIYLLPHSSDQTQGFQGRDGVVYMRIARSKAYCVRRWRKDIKGSSYTLNETAHWVENNSPSWTSTKETQEVGNLIIGRS
jgi:hypothetical protein